MVPWLPAEAPRDEGVVVVVVEPDGAALEAWLLSSSASLASSAARVDCADATDSLSAVVSSVPSVCPALTCSPGTALSVWTFPPTWNAAEA